MKKQILSFLLGGLAFLCIGCKESNGTSATTEAGSGDLYVVSIDSCEYVVYDGYRNGGIVHKQNCKYCAKRNNR